MHIQLDPGRNPATCRRRTIRMDVNEIFTVYLPKVCGLENGASLEIITMEKRSEIVKCPFHVPIDLLPLLLNTAPAGVIHHTMEGESSAEESKGDISINKNARDWFHQACSSCRYSRCPGSASRCVSAQREPFHATKAKTIWVMGVTMTRE